MIAGVGDPRDNGMGAVCYRVLARATFGANGHDLTVNYASSIVDRRLCFSVVSGDPPEGGRRNEGKNYRSGEDKKSEACIEESGHRPLPRARDVISELSRVLLFHR